MHLVNSNERLSGGPTMTPLVSHARTTQWVLRRRLAASAWIDLRPARALQVALSLGLLGLIAIAAMLRPFEYDESYLYFYLGGLPRPDWPIGLRTVGTLRAWVEGGSSGFLEITRNLIEYETHPPLHFWLLKLWRSAFGPDPLVARGFSVLCAAASLMLVWRLAAVVRVPGIPAVACTFLGYAVFYPSTLARAYALALLLVLWGTLILVTLLRDMEAAAATSGAQSAGAVKPGLAPAYALAQALMAGVAFGLAGLSHYLALIAGAAILGAFSLTVLRWWRPLPVLAAGLGLLPPFLGILAVRANQGTAEWFHPDFDLARDVWRVLEMQSAAVFGRLPLLSDEPWRLLLAALIVPALLGLFGIIGFGMRAIVADPVRRVLLVGALAMPVGLFAFSILVDRAPFVSRYCSYSLPFVALCFAAGLAELHRRWPRLAAAAFGYVLMWQVMGAGAQMAWTATQQEYRGIVADVAASWVPGRSALIVPTGYDHIGKNGPYLWEAPADWPMAVIDVLNPMDQFLEGLGPTRHLFVVTFTERAGEHALEALKAALPAAGWSLTATGPYLEHWSR